MGNCFKTPTDVSSSDIIEKFLIKLETQNIGTLRGAYVCVCVPPKSEDPDRKCICGRPIEWIKHQDRTEYERLTFYILLYSLVHDIRCTPGLRLNADVFTLLEEVWRQT